MRVALVVMVTTNFAEPVSTCRRQTNTMRLFLSSKNGTLREAAVLRSNGC